MLILLWQVVPVDDNATVNAAMMNKAPSVASSDASRATTGAFHKVGKYCMIRIIINASAQVRGHVVFVTTGYNI